MNIEFLKVINTVCREHADLSLRISDIINIEEIQNSEDGDMVFLHCKNDCGMFEFKMSIRKHPTFLHNTFSVSVREVEGSPYSCDNFDITITL